MSKMLNSREFWMTVACAFLVISAPFCAKIIADYFAVPHKPPRSVNVRRLSLNEHKDNSTKHELTLKRNQYLWSWPEDFQSPTTIMTQQKFHLAYDKYLRITIPTESDTVKHMYNLIWPWRNLQFNLEASTPSNKCYAKNKELLVLPPPPVTTISALSQ